MSMKNCPFCGSNDVEEMVCESIKWGECHECGTQGPTSAVKSKSKWGNRPVEEALQLRLNASEARNAELSNLLCNASDYVSELSDSLINACEDFEGDDEDDPKAREECAEAREFVKRVKVVLTQSAPATDEQGAGS